MRRLLQLCVVCATGSGDTVAWESVCGGPGGRKAEVEECGRNDRGDGGEEGEALCGS